MVVGVRKKAGAFKRRPTTKTRKLRGRGKKLNKMRWSGERDAGKDV